jgi:hypothetical protein
MDAAMLVTIRKTKRSITSPGTTDEDVSPDTSTKGRYSMAGYKVLKRTLANEIYTLEQNIEHYAAALKNQFLEELNGE